MFGRNLLRIADIAASKPAAQKRIADHAKV
jgi:hypothetical protein